MIGWLQQMNLTGTLASAQVFVWVPKSTGQVWHLLIGHGFRQLAGVRLQAQFLLEQVFLQNNTRDKKTTN
jgi:hypothetical protein